MLAACLLGIAGEADAANDPFAPGQTDFLVGVEAFHAGFYDAALESFQRARSAGFTAPTLDFNLGLSFYKLGRYPEARGVFERMRADPQFSDIAEYHLGLIAAQLDQQDVAVAHLRKVQRTAGSAKLKALAQAALDRILGRPGGGNGGSNAYLSAGLGYDSNPVLLADNSGEPQQGPDWYGEAVGSYGINLAADAASSDRLRGTFYLRQYHKDTDLSQQDATLSYQHSTWGPDWRLDLGAIGETLYVGGENLQSSGGLLFEGSRKLLETWLSLHAQANRVAGGSGSTYLDGWQEQAGLAWAVPVGQGRLRASYDFETNDRRDLDFGSEFFSESPLRHELGLRLSQPWNDRLSLEGRASYRYTRYRAPDHFFVGNDLVVERRTEKLFDWGASARYRLYPGWNLLMQYEYSRNLANIPGFMYRRDVASFAVEWTGR